MQNPSKRNIKLIEITSELGAGKRGAGLGPTALRFADLNKGRKKINRYPYQWIEDENEALRLGTKTEYAKFIEQIATVLPKVSSGIEQNLHEGYFPLILSGDHSNAAGSISGVKNFIGDKRLGVIWIDAHADLHSPYTTPSGNMHGMPLAMLLAEDNLACQSNDPDELTIKLWNDLKRIGNPEISPKINPQDIVLIDIRDLERQEWELIDEKQIEFYTPKEIKEYGIERVAKETLEYLKDCDFLYISFDVDSLDPSISKGTGTPYPDGLQLHEAKTLLYHLLRTPKTIAFEITEINPLLDNSNKMAQTVLEILEEVL